MNPPGPNASNDENMRFLIASALETRQQLCSVSLQLQETKDLLAANQKRISTLEEHVTTVEQELKSLKETVNFREQKFRILNIRILGVPQSEDEVHGPDAAAAAAKTAYDWIIKPLLVAAKAKGIVASVPNLSNSISQAYRMKNRAGPSRTSPPPLLVTLQSPAIKTAIFRAKKDALPSPSESDVAAGSARFTVTEDLTSNAAEFLKQLRGHKKVARAWSVDGIIRYIKDGDKDNNIHRVRSIFDSIEHILA